MGEREKLDQIQVLRAVAAIAVMLGHIPALGTIGGWGVDLFFIISGFIVCYITGLDRSHFFGKRIARIVPLYWAGTLAVFAVAWAAPGMVGTVEPRADWLLKSLFFIPFDIDGSWRPLLNLGWTLNHEMFFYAVFAVSMAISFQYRALICAGAFIALAAAYPLLTGAAAFEASPIILEFILGFIAYWLWERISPRRFAAGRLPILAIAALIVVAMMLLPVPGPRVLTWGLPMFAAFLLVLFAGQGIRWPWLIVLIGDASYALYLFHPYVLNAAERIGLPEIVGAVLAAGLSIASFKLFEVPVNRWLRRALLAEKARPVIS